MSAVRVTAVSLVLSVASAVLSVATAVLLLASAVLPDAVSPAMSVVSFVVLSVVSMCSSPAAAVAASSWCRR